MSDLKDKMNQRVTQRSAARASFRDMQRDIAARQTAQVDRTMRTPLDDIAIDERIQVRVGGLNEETVERYAAIMEEHGSYEPFPPVVLFRDPETETLWLSAGFHRVEAARRAIARLIADKREPFSGVLAEVRPGGFEAAYWFAITDNLTNGLQMAHVDQKEALRRLLGYDLKIDAANEYVTMSNRQLAGIIGVTHRTIGLWRRELEDEAHTGGYQYPPESTLRQGADGKVYDVSGIQESNQQRVQSEPDPPPASPRQELKLFQRPTPPRYADQDGGYQFDQSPEYEEPAVNLDDAGPVGEWNDEPPAQPAQPLPSARVHQLRRSVLDHLIQAAADLRELGEESEAVSFDQYADSLAREWRLA
ncbi:MAG: hypothetical protein JW910_09565 [Anaerolineae bacterium]|nr:hypothetical protein [Anaerolineae bacterium]